MIGASMAVRQCTAPPSNWPARRRGVATAMLWCSAMACYGCPGRSQAADAPDHEVTV